MFNFTFHTPTEIVFGNHTEQETGNMVQKYGGTNVLLHYGSGSVIRSGLLDRIKRSLQDAHISYVELGGVVPNPQLSLVYKGIALARQENVDFILAVGGGSVIDSAKAIAYGLAEPDKDVWDLYAHTRKATAAFPLGTVLTIAAAGSEMSPSSVITNDATKEKRAYDDDLSRPKFAIMNPALTMTLPDYQTASGCADIMMHTMERYFTQGGNMDLTDNFAAALLRTVMKHAKILHQDPQNYESRAEVMWASSLSHNGLTGCGNDGGDFATHMLEHELGGMFNVTHGAGLTALWPSWARYVYKNDLPRFVKFAIDVMQVPTIGTAEEIALRGIQAMEDFYHTIGMPTTLKELGIQPTDDQIEELATRCAQATNGHQGSAKVLYKKDMAAIYHLALH